MVICPVPKDQIPTNEFKEFANSWFFKLPLNNRINLFKFIFKAWLFSIPIISILSEGSYELRNRPVQFLLTVFLFSLGIPIFLFVRQLIGWNYIYKRLTTKEIEYEESDWHDGQRWTKTLEMNNKDILIAKHEVLPLINFIQICLKICIYELVLISIIYILVIRTYN